MVSLFPMLSITDLKLGSIWLIGMTILSLSLSLVMLFSAELFQCPIELAHEPYKLA